jgi:hypothetical protein
MKALIFALALLPGLAHAHGAAVSCVTQGTLGDVRLSIVSSGSLLDESSRVTITSQGFRHLVFVTAAQQVSNADGVLVVDVKELGPNDGIKPDGAQATLTLKTKQITPEVSVPEGTGTLNVTQRPQEGGVTIGGVYELSECDGVL